MSAKRASYSDITTGEGTGYMDQRLPFIGNSMAATWCHREPIIRGDGESAALAAHYSRGPDSMMRREDIDGPAVYVVYSYRTVIAVHDPETGFSHVSENHWGRTTGKHIGYCRRSLPRVRSNDESALEGVGPGSRVSYKRPGSYGPDVPSTLYGRVQETYPLANAVVIRPEYGYGTDREILPVREVELV